MKLTTDKSEASDTRAAMPTANTRRRLVLAALVLAVLGATFGTWLAWSKTGAAMRSEWHNRSPQELIRYTLRRLEGHSKLEWLMQPTLFAIQREIEREPPTNLPTLGKGQQSVPMVAPDGITRELKVDTPQGIREALLSATAGTRIIVAPGLYPFSLKLRVNHPGLSGFPILLTAERPGTVFFEFGQVEGVLVDQPHWVFENLNIRGVCTRHDDCEHAFHVVGAAEYTTIRNNHISDFNAHIKVNGFDGHWPDHGLLQHNTLSNSAPRKTDNPVTPFDLVGANGWHVQDNLVKDFAKRDGNQVSFGLFMKGASENGRIERNLVICSTNGISSPGVRVGISFGGGGTDPNVCRHAHCGLFEHRNGLIANNVVAHCNDVGIDINHARGIQVIHNTVVNTAGIGARLAPASATLSANLVDGDIYARDGAALLANEPKPPSALSAVQGADLLQITPKVTLPPVARKSLVTNDFFQRPRKTLSAPGAVEFSQ